MATRLTRRRLFQLPGAGMLLSAERLRDQGQAPVAVLAPTIVEYKPRSRVSLVQGDSRQANVHQALMAVDDQIRPGWRRPSRS